MKFTSLLCGLLAMGFPATILAKPTSNGNSSGLRNAVILVIRHAEKPASGYHLSPAGKARAKAYANYFRNFSMDGQPLKLDSLFAAADTKVSHRARLTIEPTAKMLGLRIDTRFEDVQFTKLANEIRTKPHGQNIFICWHHGEIPQLLQALGADAGQLLPNGKWPDDVYNWVIELRYDTDGQLVEAKRVNEPF